MSEQKGTHIIDAEKDKLEIHYCIPTWLRDLQVKMNCAKYHNRIQPEGLKEEPIAIVCFGPSLNDTWTEIKKFRYVFSCSGSYKYLRERGITPTYHNEVDPRAHKIELIGNDISSDTKFLMASCVHPKVLEHLKKYNANIILWHTYSGEPEEVVPTIFPQGEWVSMGGANVGLRALTLARLLGFTNLHIFGMDGSFPKDGYSHAAEHPHSQKKYILAEFDGKTYATTQSFLECARGTFHELRMLPDVRTTFYGDGLIQRMAIKYGKEGNVKVKDKVEIAFKPLQTISSEYREQNRLLHENNAEYGVSVINHLQLINDLYLKCECKSLLDYGCGKGLLAKNVPFPIWEYDPAIPGKDIPPRAADLVVCIDVLEHVEPDYLDSVLKDIARCVQRIGFFVINTQPAQKTLPDGRNTHLIQRDRHWWESKLAEFFIIPKQGIKESKKELLIVAGPKKMLEKNRESFILEKEKSESRRGDYTVTRT